MRRKTVSKKVLKKASPKKAAAKKKATVRVKRVAKRAPVKRAVRRSASRSPKRRTVRRTVRRVTRPRAVRAVVLPGKDRYADSRPEASKLAVARQIVSNKNIGRAGRFASDRTMRGPKGDVIGMYKGRDAGQITGPAVQYRHVA